MFKPSRFKDIDIENYNLRQVINLLFLILQYYYFETIYIRIYFNQISSFSVKWKIKVCLKAFPVISNKFVLSPLYVLNYSKFHIWLKSYALNHNYSFRKSIDYWEELKCFGFIIWNQIMCFSPTFAQNSKKSHL